MDRAKQHWPILGRLGTDLSNKVRSFMVIGRDGKGVILATEDGLAFWLGTIEFGWGDSITATEPTLLNVQALDSMAHGDFHILLLSKRGEIYAMGENRLGELGLGTEDKEIPFLPKLISSPNKFISVRCGSRHSLALTEDGKVWAWGSNCTGQVGKPRFTRSLSSPSQITELDPHRVAAVECGNKHSLALTDRGEVYAWGSNEFGQLGVESGSSHKYQPTPNRISTPSPVQSIAAGSHHTLLLTQTGEVYGCGLNPTSTKSSSSLVKVAGLPPISQIESHYAFDMPIALSSNKRCFVWGQLRNESYIERENWCISVSAPKKLSSDYSTVDSPLSLYSLQRNTPHSVTIPETPPSRLSTRMSRMFDNPETSPDVQFVVEQRTIHAHRNILSNFSDYFSRMFSERWMAQVDPEDPIVRVTISDHSYQVFYAFLRFFYTDCFEVNFDLLPDLFELANQYLESDLQQLCISRMRTTLTPFTCCFYYPLTHRHSLPELEDFQEDLVQFASTRMSEITPTATYESMEPDLRDQLTNAVLNFSGT